MAVTAAVGAPTVSGCKPNGAAPVPVPSSDGVTGEAVLTEAALMEAMPASALPPRSGSAELPLLDAEDLGVELKQRSNSVQVRLNGNSLDDAEKGLNRVPSACSAFNLQLVPRPPSAEGPIAT